MEGQIRVDEVRDGLGRASFETGILTASDWVEQWIPENSSEKEPDR